MENTKVEAYKKILNDLNIGDTFRNALIQLIENYDGSNKKEFDTFIDQLMAFLLNYSMVENKARSFDLVEQNHIDFMDNIENIKESFAKVENGEFPSGDKSTIRDTGNVESDTEENQTVSE